MILEKLSPPSLRDQVLSVLRKRLATGELRPGELYSASALAAELGVSTSPTREAMLTLVEQGALVAERNRGFRVAVLGDRDRDDIQELRFLIEVPSMVRLAGNPVLRGAEEEFRDIVRENIRAAHAGDLVAYLDSDLRFHTGLLRLLGNDRLADLVATLRLQTRQLGLSALSGSPVLVRTAEEHGLILDALLAGDAHRVSTLMCNHLNHIYRDWTAPGEPASFSAATPVLSTHGS